MSSLLPEARNFFQISRRSPFPLLYIRAMIARPGTFDSESLLSAFLGESATHMRPSLAPMFYPCFFSRKVYVFDFSQSQAKWIYTSPDRGARRVVGSSQMHRPPRVILL